MIYIQLLYTQELVANPTQSRIHIVDGIVFKYEYFVMNIINKVASVLAQTEYLPLKQS